jgi:enamine deaminase RidA (YjgF/YER057c/UK114 family)
VGTEVLDLLRACVKVIYYCDLSSAGPLTCVKSIETYVDSAFATVSDVLADRFSYVLVRTVRSSCIASSHLIKEA